MSRHGNKHSKGKDNAKRKWELESELSSLLDFADMKGRPRIQLEQYATSGHLAAHVLYTIHSSFGETEGHTVLDLGCGPGCLGLGAALLGASHVVGVDICRPALEVALKNKASLELGNVDFIQADVLTLAESGLLSSYNQQIETTPSSSSSSPEQLIVRPLVKVFDIAIINPPFGTKQKGVDMQFLRQGLQLVRKAVYSFHKTSTRAHIEKVSKGWGVKGEVLAELVFDLPKMYKSHRKETVDIRVDFWRFEIPPGHVLKSTTKR